MKLTRTRTLRFNIGAYEHIETSATVEADTDELEITDDKGIADYMTRLLDQLVQDDVDRADQVSVTPDDQTTVHSWKDSI